MSESMSSQSSSQALLELRDVRRGYYQGESRLDVLNGANLSVRAGEMKALVGPSGSGKSTLLNIAGFICDILFYIDLYRNHGISIDFIGNTPNT